MYLTGVPDAIWIVMLLAATAAAYIAGGYVGKKWG